ncbi:toprim domain-containing protein [Mucilaginibacter sp. UR6-1]|uniref:toprim domain-containing protein n=1 Tax=Mucilaginibacter sp. UR6-1 TaxID=1435643 RepID=UPI001E2A9ACC|nr:toprim domain-containing protein [Mucilaginibacter sp. UR6-1]MCC8407722.1 toprim domain-containing protein [Mucilaginibacter sp. UR6-1]
MTQLLNAKELKEQASIVDLLSRLGFEPVKKFGKEYMYRSMLREGDNDPSFSVDDKLGAWYDHGTGKGGNIIDLGLACWPDLKFNEVVEKIQVACNMGPPVRREARPRLPVRTRNYVIESIKTIGTHPAITAYLQSRGVFDIAKNRLNEVYYHVKNEKGEKKQFFAAGWKNEAGSWEVRNRYFKGCLGQKAISIIPGDPKSVAVFEGYMNYLSWLRERRGASQSVIVLNTLSLLAEGIRQAIKYPAIDLFLDRDTAGLHATKDFIKALPYASDRSGAYEKFNDYNDKLVAGLKAERLLPASGDGPRGRSV